MPKQHQAVLGSTKMRVQNSVPDTPTLSRSFAVAPFQLVPVQSSASTVLPPNPAARLRVGVWGEPWDKTANYFEVAYPQLRFLSQGQKRVGYEALNHSEQMPKRPIGPIATHLVKRIVASGFADSHFRSSKAVRYDRVRKNRC